MNGHPTDDAADLDAYRARASVWLAENLERDQSQPHAGSAQALRGRQEYTGEHIDAQRVEQRHLHAAGYAGITVPVAYGGQGLSHDHERVFLEEARGYRLPDFGSGGGTSHICAEVMLAHGSEDVKRRHVPRILAGGEVWVQLFSEPAAGSDLAGVRTAAVRDGDSWILNGAKVWSTFGHLADWGLCLARTNWDAPKHRGLTWFGVPLGAPGVTVRLIRQINGGGDFCEEFFDDVVISDDERIGDVDAGWPVARTMLVFERGGGVAAEPDAAPLDPGLLAPDLVAIARAVDRTGDPATRQLVARGHMLDVLHAALKRRIAASLGHSSADAGLAAYGKLAQGTFDAERARIGMEIGRGASIAWHDSTGPEATTALAFLNGKINAIAGGTDQMQRNAIGEQVLGLPREPSFDRDKAFREVVRDAANWTG